MTSEAGSVGIGARLRAARERRGLTTLQAAEKLHVDARVLESLEADNFAPLGADVYVRGHLRRYAELVGESPHELQDLYAKTGPVVQPDLTRIPRGERPPESARFMMPALLTVVALALAGILWWALTLPGAKPQVLPPPPAAAPVADTEAADAAPAAGAPVVAAAPVAPSAGPQPPAVGVPGGQTLTLHFAGGSWAQVADAHGRLLLDGMQAAGSSRSVSGPAPLRVVLGNAPQVGLEVGGRPATLAGFVRRRGDAHFQVDASGALSADAAHAAKGD
jgi:cytoskeleton protein RodZ